MLVESTGQVPGQLKLWRAKGHHMCGLPCLRWVRLAALYQHIRGQELRGRGVGGHLGGHGSESGYLLLQFGDNLAEKQVRLGRLDLAALYSSPAPLQLVIHDDGALSLCQLCRM